MSKRSQKTTTEELYHSLKVCEPQTLTEIADTLGRDRRSLSLLMLDLLSGEKKEHIAQKKIGKTPVYWLKPTAIIDDLKQAMKALDYEEKNQLIQHCITLLE